jgi:N-acetylneuraminic acid mutarotase
MKSIVFGALLLLALIPAGRTLVQLDNLHELRAAHSATLLPNGKVLLVAGFRKGPDTYSQLYSNTAELYDPASRSFTYTGSLHMARCGQTATLLAGEKEVLITGGNNDKDHLATAELYNVQTGQWTKLPDMCTGREGHQAFLLKNGKVLIIGGAKDPRLMVELFDPVTRRFDKGPLPPVDGLGSTTAVALQDGRILLAGGTHDRQLSRAAMIYDPPTNQFTPTGDMTVARYKTGAALLPDGKVLIIGGSDNRDWKGKYSSTDCFDPRTNTFTKGPELNFQRFKLWRSVVTLKNGMVIVAGGDKHIETFDPQKDSFTVADTFDQALYFATATVLPSGEVLIAGGYGDNVQPVSKAWIYKPKAQ